MNVTTDGDVVVWLTRSEMGQGVATALPMLIAEEMEADWSRVRVEQAVPGGDLDYGSMLTVASASVRSLWTELRRSGAVARHMLEAAAASEWGVPRRECRARDGLVVHAGSGRELDFGNLAELAARQRAPLRPRLKAPEEFTLIGRRVPRMHAEEKVSGQALYGIDVRQPGMFYCAISRPPSVGATLAAVDDQRALATPGVMRVEHVDSGIAVIAKNTYAAFSGREALDVSWENGPFSNVGTDEVAKALRDSLTGPPLALARDDADVLQRLESTDRRHVSAYSVPFLAHAPMEPMNCTAHIDAGRCEVWVPTQDPQGARQRAAQVSGLPLDQIRVHTTLLGGGFGRRTASDFVAEAVAVAARVDRPVQVVWSREDDIRHGEFRDAACHEIEAALDAKGKPVAWRHRVATAAAQATLDSGRLSDIAVMGAVDHPYEVGLRRIEWSAVVSPVRLRIWRSVGYSYTVFAIESFLDELAVNAESDPLEYRLQLLGGDHRLQNCLESVADQADWARGRQQGRALGVAAASCFGSRIAMVVEVDRSEATPPRARHVWCAVDCGIAIDPANVRAQVIGGVVFGLSAAMREQIHVENGEVVEGNFDRYRLMRMHEAPSVDVNIMASAEHPGGVGELAVPPIGPAYANAVFTATGQRLREQPFASAASG